MTSIVLERARTLREYRLDTPDPHHDQVLLRVSHVCVRDRDLDGFYYGRGKLPRVFGSALVGTVVEPSASERVIPFIPGAERPLAAGTRVLVIFDDDEDGGLREYVAVPAGRCHVIDAAVAEESLPLLPDLALAAGTLGQMQAAEGQTLIVLGARASGVVLALVAQAAGMNVVVVDPSQPRLRQAADMGIEHVVNPIAASLPEELDWFTGGRVDFMVDTSGDPEHMPAALASLHAGSVLGLTEPLDFAFNLQDVTERDISIVSLADVEPDVEAAVAIAPAQDLSGLVSLSVPLIEIPAVVPSIVRERGTFLRLVGYLS